MRPLGRLLHPAWWRLRYGEQFSELVATAGPERRNADLVAGVARLERKRWSPMRLLAAVGIAADRRNSDFMADVLKSIPIQYAAANSGTSILALQESIVNYGGNAKPELLGCLHEEIAVALAHGFARVDRRPMLVLLHGTVGLHHAALAIRQAYVDRAPVLLAVGNGARGFRAHSARDIARPVREDLKWDDDPKSLEEFTVSAARAVKIATTPPAGPVLLSLDQLMQEAPFDHRHIEIPPVVATMAPCADRGAIAEIADRVTRAQRPLIVAQRAARTPTCLDLLAELAEVAQAPVHSIGWLNIRNRHPLAGSGGCGYRPDVVLLLETDALAGDWSDAEVISLSLSTAPASPHSLDVYGDAEVTLPLLIEECRRRISGGRGGEIEMRGRAIGERHRLERERWSASAAREETSGPVHGGRLAAELWQSIRNEDWSLVASGGSPWPLQLWDFDSASRFAGDPGAGVRAGSAVGAALANRPHGRVSIALLKESELACAPGVLWTAAHHRIPLLCVAERTADGTMDVPLLAKSLGVWSEGPIANPLDLALAFARGLERVKRGEPALIEVVTTCAQA